MSGKISQKRTFSTVPNVENGENPASTHSFMVENAEKRVAAQNRNGRGFRPTPGEILLYNSNDLVFHKTIGALAQRRGFFPATASKSVRTFDISFLVPIPRMKSRCFFTFSPGLFRSFQCFPQSLNKKWKTWKTPRREL